MLRLWFAIIFVALATWDLAPEGLARTILLCAGAVILLFNTAAIMAMLRHYRQDRDFMYGLDIAVPRPGAGGAESEIRPPETVQALAASGRRDPDGHDLRRGAVPLYMGLAGGAGSRPTHAKLVVSFGPWA